LKASKRDKENGKYKDVFSERLNNVTPGRYNKNKANVK
jgi:hypothetical protein